jgi:hypothetical protein
MQRSDGGKPWRGPGRLPERAKGDMMLVDEIIRALRDPDYRAQLMAEVHGALPDSGLALADQPDADQESGSEA